MTAVLTLDRVSRSFWRGTREVTVLRDVTLTVTAGRIVGIQGGRNAGKTTLLRIAAGVDAPDTGRVLIDGEDLAHLSRRRRVQTLRPVALVDHAAPIDPYLSVLDLVALPLHRQLSSVAALRQARIALEEAGVDDVADARWAELSNTDRSLVALAQALVTDPRLLLIDDPIAGALDVVEQERIMSLIRTVAARGCAVVLAVPSAEAGIMGAHVDAIGALSLGRLHVTDRHTDGPPGTVVPFPDQTSA